MGNGLDLLLCFLLVLMCLGLPFLAGVGLMVWFFVMGRKVSRTLHSPEAQEIYHKAGRKMERWLED